MRPSGRPAPKARPERHGPVVVEVISIGRDLLRGQVADTNARTLARFLTRHGASLRRITTVSDEEAAIASALREALGRNPHLVVTTGGLGPGLEDRTLAAVAEALVVPLAIHHEAKALVEEAYERLRRAKIVRAGGLTAARERMCTLPLGGAPVANPAGIAPGVVCRLTGGAWLLCLPGLPEEMEAMLAHVPQLLPMLAAAQRLAQREIESPTADESTLGPLLERLTAEFPEVWIDSHPRDTREPGARVMISLEAAAPSNEEANATVEGVVKRLLALAAGSP